MSPMIWILFMFGYVAYQRSSAKFCMRRYVNGKWISQGDCGGPERMSEMQKEVKLRAERERKWTVFQKRINGDVDFYRGWDDYEKGFGNPKGDFWLGLAELHEKTKGGDIELEINMIENNTGIHRVAKYSNFKIGSSSENYKITVSGYSGNATDRLSRHSNQQFSTKDADHDSRVSENCASSYEGGWWYYNCAYSNLNGSFNKTDGKGFWWRSVNSVFYYWNYDSGNWDGSYEFIRFSEMKFSRKL